MYKGKLKAERVSIKKSLVFVACVAFVPDAVSTEYVSEISIALVSLGGEQLASPRGAPGAPWREVGVPLRTVELRMCPSGSGCYIKLS